MKLINKQCYYWVWPDKDAGLLLITVFSGSACSGLGVFYENKIFKSPGKTVQISVIRSWPCCSALWVGRCWIYKLIGWFDLVRTNDYTVTRVFYLPQTSRELDLHIRFDLSALDLGSLTRWCWRSWWSLARSWWVWLLAVMLQYGSLVMTSHTFTLATTCLISVKSSEKSCSTFNI